MGTGKQIKKYREQRKWTLQDLSTASDVDVGTIGALEVRDSSRSKYFPALAKALALTLEQLADESNTYTPGIAAADNMAMEPMPNYGIGRSYDKWTAEAIAIMASLDIEQRQGMVARMREFKQFLGPPCDGQALSVAG